jgi:hypothetical protein
MEAMGGGVTAENRKKPDHGLAVTLTLGLAPPPGAAQMGAAQMGGR